jgi:hypothetical protein
MPTLCSGGRHHLSPKVIHFTNILEKIIWKRGVRPPILSMFRNVTDSW